MRIQTIPSPSTNAEDTAILMRMCDTFDILYDMSEAVAEGKIKGMVVFGPPGVGKSHNVKEALLNEAAINHEFGSRYKIVSGHMTTVNLYMLLYKYRYANNVIVLDDVDSALGTAESLNLLKAALDTTDTRTISYMAESRTLEKNNIPKSFVFSGGIIVITNIDMANYTGKNREHMAAIISRCHYLDLSIKTKHEKMLWLKHVTIQGGMLKKRLTDEQAAEVIAFVDKHQNNMRELSLRMMSKVADLRVTNPNDWQKVAKITCMT